MYLKKTSLGNNICICFLFPYATHTECNYTFQVLYVPLFALILYRLCCLFLAEKKLCAIIFLYLFEGRHPLHYFVLRDADFA